MPGFNKRDPMNREFGKPKFDHRITATGPITAQNFSARSEVHLAKRGSGTFPAIKLGTPEYVLWFEYFDRHLEFWPFSARLMVERLQAGEISEMVVPETDPVLFDPDFLDTPGYQPRPLRPRDAPFNPAVAAKFELLMKQLAEGTLPSRSDGTDYASMFARYGRPQGRFEKHAPPRAGAQGPAAGTRWQRMTDEDLFARYRPAAVAEEIKPAPPQRPADAAL